MCIICIEYLKGSLTQQEARRNLGEMKESMDPSHVEEVEERLNDPFWRNTSERSRKDRQNDPRD